MNLKLVILRTLSLYSGGKGAEGLLKIEVGMSLAVGDSEWAGALRELQGKGMIKEVERHKLTNDKQWCITKKGEEAMLP